MNIEMTDLDMILNYLETTSLEPHDDYTSEFTYKDQKILYKYIKELQQENQQLKIQISAREEEYKRLGDKLVETENWLRFAILQLMEIAKQDYYWITDQQIDNAKRVPIEFTVMGDRSVKFKKLERGVSNVKD